MLNHNYFGGLHVGAEIVHCLLGDYKKTLEKDCEQKEEPCFLCFILLHFQSL